MWSRSLHRTTFTYHDSSNIKISGPSFSKIQRTYYTWVKPGYGNIILPILTVLRFTTSTNHYICFSILFFYLRIFPERNFRRVVYEIIACCVGHIIAFALISISQCRPIPFSRKRWDGDHKGTCNNINTQSWAASAINIFLDLFIIFLPMPQLAKLALSFRRKIQIILMFGVGFL